MILKCFYDGKSVTVQSERAAKSWARGRLGVRRIFETPTENGWQYWSEQNPESDETPVTVIVQ